MTEEVFTVTVHPPSRTRIIKATAIALVVSIVLLITAVLPAEYGIDPLGTGKALRLMDLAKADAAKAVEKPAEAAPAKAGEASYTITPVLEPVAGGGAPRVQREL